MPLILGWYCPHSGKMFKEKDKYRKHLKKQAKERFEKRKKARFSKSRDEFVTRMGQVVKTIPELEQYIRDNWDWFSYNGFYNDVISWGRSSTKDFNYPKLVSINIEVTKRDKVSNSHNCPKDGVTNWGGDKVMPDGNPAPRNYPGWYGRIQFVISKNCNYGSSCFDETAIKTGSGSGGRDKNNNSTYQYECSLFESDFPAMTDYHYANENWKTLGGKDLLEMA